jgi:hypothetical protein
MIPAAARGFHLALAVTCSITVINLLIRARSLAKSKHDRSQRKNIVCNLRDDDDDHDDSANVKPPILDLNGCAFAGAAKPERRKTFDSQSLVLIFMMSNIAIFLQVHLQKKFATVRIAGNKFEPRDISKQSRTS